MVSIIQNDPPRTFSDAVPPVTMGLVHHACLSLNGCVGPPTIIEAISNKLSIKQSGAMAGRSWTK